MSTTLTPFYCELELERLNPGRITIGFKLIGSFGPDATIDWGNGKGPQKINNKYIRTAYTDGEAGDKYLVKLSDPDSNIESFKFVDTDTPNIVRIIINKLSGESILYLLSTFSKSNVFKIEKEALNLPNLSELSKCFFNSSLEEVYDDLFNNCPNIFGINRCFANCKIIEIPNTLFHNLKKIDSLVGVFENNINLKTIPDDIFTYVIARDYRYLFNNCYNIKSAVPNIWENSSFRGYKCFSGCINAINYNEIPDNWKGL